jgi:CBS domain-containing protein
VRVIIPSVDIVRFLAEHSPFDALEPGRLEDLAGRAQIEFYPEGSTIVRGGGEAPRSIYVIRSGAVEVLAGGRVLDLLLEGDVFGEMGQVGSARPAASDVVIRAHEDTLCYLIDQDAIEEALASVPRPPALFRATSARRYRAGDTNLVPSEWTAVTIAGSLVRRPPVSCEGHVTVAEASRLMASERVSSVLIPTGGAWGIITDRDLRTRVLASGRSPETPIAEVMTFPVTAVPETMTADEVLLLMLEHGFHHAPVLDEAGELLGMVTDTDLLALERASPFALKSAIERAPDGDEVIRIATRVPQVVTALVDARMDPVSVGRIVGVTIDAMTRRLLDLAIDLTGEPPVPWAWLAFGSQARHEQALRTDQDHGLAFDVGDAEEAKVQSYFADLARRVTDGLESAGIPRCPGDVMAENPALRRSVESWKEAFRTWMSDPARQGSVSTSITFDYRRVAGPLDIEPVLDDVVATAPTYPAFIRRLAARALDERPPTGFFRHRVVEAKGEHAGHLDVKHRGIMLIGNLARLYTIRLGRTEKRTLSRLEAASAAGLIGDDERAGLQEAFRLLWQIRLEHQVRSAREGIDPDDYVDPKMLGPISRRGLREAFTIIAGQQRAIALEFGIR